MKPNNYKYKLIRKGKEAREGLYQGIKIVAEIVGATLGPSGRNVILEDFQTTRARPPIVTNDGVSIAKRIILEDEIEDLGAQALIDTAVKTNKAVGDGTTTSIVLAHAVIKKVFDQIKNIIGTSENLIELREKINESKKRVVEELKKMAKPCEDLETLKKVAIVSLQDKEIGEIVADMVYKIGFNGFVDVDDNVRPRIEQETIQGMKVYAEYASYLFINNRARRKAIWEETPVFVTNLPIETMVQLNSLGLLVQKDLQKSKFAIVAPDFSKEMLAVLLKTNATKPLNVLPIKAKALRDVEFEDIAVYTGSTFFDKSKEAQIDKDHLTKNDFGLAKKIVAGEDQTIIIGGGGKKEDIEQRIEDLKIQREEVEETPTFQKKLERRIASLSAGVGVIKVGAVTEIERKYLKHKIEDAVNASKVALEEGVVRGGGLALKEISKRLSEDDILKDCLCAPHDKIQENAGGKLKIGEDILDPVKVTRIAFENACSMAGTFITTEGTVCWNRHTTEESLKNIGFLKNQ